MKNLYNVECSRQRLRKMVDGLWTNDFQWCQHRVNRFSERDLLLGGGGKSRTLEREGEGLYPILRRSLQNELYAQQRERERGRRINTEFVAFKKAEWKKNWLFDTRWISLLDFSLLLWCVRLFWDIQVDFGSERLGSLSWLKQQLRVW